nr:zinc finger, CCHC-type [Tanacetum cinerariifolium]
MIFLRKSPRTILPNFSTRGKTAAGKALEALKMRSYNYKHIGSFNPRKVALLFSALSSLGAIVLICLTLRVKQIGDKNPIRTLGDYSNPSHEDYRNTIELPVGNNVVPLRSDIIRLVQNGCSFHGLWSEDPNQHLRDFIKLVDSLVLDGENRERTRLRLFQLSLCDQASN